MRFYGHKTETGELMTNNLRALARGLAVTIAITCFGCVVAWVALNVPSFQLTQSGTGLYILIALASPLFGVVLAYLDYKERKKQKRGN